PGSAIGGQVNRRRQKNGQDKPGVREGDGHGNPGQAGSATKAISQEQRTGTAGVRPYGNLSTAKVCLNRAPCAVIGAQHAPVCASAHARPQLPPWVPGPACCCA
ncbi:unnamed protein product, partial [Staurois parvus]